jgi:hypothetical protein
VIPFGPTVHTLTVTLRDVEPEVWRRLTIKSETKLPAFARVLERVMGWQGYHLHAFAVGDVIFGEPDEEFETDYTIDHRKITVEQVLPRVGSILRWDYDFGDGWEHDIVVESIDSPVEGKRYPVCLGGERACPPEDCGGVSGYEDLLRVLADPTDDEHEHMVTWAGEGFDPAAFDLVAANRRMRGR